MAPGDQQRMDTPHGAILAGSTHLVVGRQITTANDPVEALDQIEEEIAHALATA
jgi:orotidine-5'-phosphate decarboxylase